MQQRKPAGVLNGWPFVGVASVAILASVAAAIAITPDVGEAAGRAVRLTARTSVALFLAAFTASALFRLWPNAWTRWQRQNRRYLGVSFAVSHGVHLAAIFWLKHVQPVEFAQRGECDHLDRRRAGLCLHRRDDGHVVRSHGSR